jgi:hypothetical protein|tara:strand:- start:109 stop:228 length:120 start_codon:yes stop_codon:yes gene_type:complete
MKKGRDVPDFQVQMALDEFYQVLEMVIESKKKNSEKKDP